MTNQNTVVATTHPPQYLIHKYWARKPHNVLAHYLKRYFSSGNLVCDPFCGSGVFLAEAKKQGIDSVGFDVNPLATLLAEVTTNPPDSRLLHEELGKLISDAENRFNSFYRLPGGDTVRYFVHKTITDCKKCNKSVTVDDCKRIGNRYSCADCGQRLSFNAENLSSTRIVKIVTAQGKTYDRSETPSEMFREHQLRAESACASGVENFDKELVTNRRILAFPGMRISTLFTQRAFSISSFLFDRAHSISTSTELRAAVLLFLTSNLAQFSRLIPYRNNLKTGGPAWTVPGFWIAPIHLETNPLILLRSREKKFIKGIEAAQKAYKEPGVTSSIENVPMQVGMKNIDDLSLDGIFFDPPYGDNVPYLEFSAIWNAFLKKEVDYDSEIVVSDRNQFKSDWTRYSVGIDNAISLFKKKLKPDGKLIMTFNNLDPRAWKIILSAFSEQGFYCSDANYQIPAVTSSKAQMASQTSYIGDFYCVFETTKRAGCPVSMNAELIIDAILPVFMSRGGRVSKNQVIRSAILAALRKNLSVDVFEKIDDLIYGIAEEDGGYFVLRSELREKYEADFVKHDLKKVIMTALDDSMSKGKISFGEFYNAVINVTGHLGQPDPCELKDLLRGTVLFDEGFCYLQETRPQQSQTSLFKV